MNWIPASDQPRSYTVQFSAPHFVWNEFAFRFTPAANGTVELKLMGPWEQASAGGPIYRQEIFWHALAAKLRATNEQLRTFFPADKQPENFLRLRRARESGAVEVTADDKVKVLREQGLSGKELTTLATFSRELRFASGSPLFEEGDEGHEMYVILEGKVLISKYIAGAGEEALAILERGDFFGEMAIVDGSPRSATATAHAPHATVLWIDEAAIEGLVARGEDSAREFLLILCRLLSARLREIDDKIVQWRLMSGGF